MASMLVGLAVMLSVATVLGQYDPNIAHGRPRSAYVHLFEWKWTDIALECERFLGPKGFAAVQVSPPNEHAVITNPLYPWWQRYQPVSYKLVSRSGNETEFIDMVTRCNNAGVRIYVDAIINHMSAAGMGVGSAGSSFNSNEKDFPGVPYGPRDFTDDWECTCKDGKIDYSVPACVRNCRLSGLPDLAIYKFHTRVMLRNYFNKLVQIGVAGFRVDAAKHMWPIHLNQLLASVNNLNTQWFPQNSRPFIYSEVINQPNEPITASEYTDSGRVTEFGYGKALSHAVLKGQALANLRTFGDGTGDNWKMINGAVAVSFVDNHDNQRGHGGGGNILTFRQPREYKIANAFMLAHKYGFPQVMSSYNWQQNYGFDSEGVWKDLNDFIGPPHAAGSPPGTTASVVITADGSCDRRVGWICEHRWRQITNMVEFRNVAGSGDQVHWWDNGINKIAFGRGAVGATTAFIAINNEDNRMNEWLVTGLPAGIYCDVISGNLVNGDCTGRRIQVFQDTKALFDISNIYSDNNDPIIAIHVNAKL
ncbi:Alpha-amylase 1 [Hypsibius exemplaris]|uniref:Alpha-amylase n=1 Tax=Hypsibius exemplaris TaxID=2072580 RepID=A0A1W0X433_HYPEX|nr:Alpha-amylase 1 [Hypsibius exemplaris]